MYLYINIYVLFHVYVFHIYIYTRLYNLILASLIFPFLEGLVCRCLYVLCAYFNMYYVQFLACLMCRFWHVLCDDFVMSYEKIPARLS